MPVITHVAWHRVCGYQSEEAVRRSKVEHAAMNTMWEYGVRPCSAKEV